MKNFVFKVDNWVGELFHKFYLWGGNFATHIMEAISFIADAGILFILIGLILSLFKRTRKIGITTLVALAIGVLFTNIILKNVIGRARPFANISSEFYKWWLDAGATYESGYSFPSGHTTATTAFAVAIFLTTNKKHSWYILFLPLLMASSRIYLMVHYFSDCMGGLVVGSICAVLAWIIVKWIYLSKLKLCVWVRELCLFKFEKKTNPITVTTIEQPKEEPIEETVYIPQSEEIKSESAIKDTAEQNANGNTNNNPFDDIDNR